MVSLIKSTSCVAVVFGLTASLVFAEPPKVQIPPRTITFKKGFAAEDQLLADAATRAESAAQDDCFHRLTIRTFPRPVATGRKFSLINRISGRWLTSARWVHIAIISLL